MSKMTGKMFAMLLKVKAQMLYVKATYGVPKSKTSKRLNRSNPVRKRFSGANEIAKRESQIERGVIRISKPFIPSVYHFKIEKGTELKLVVNG